MKNTLHAGARHTHTFTIGEAQTVPALYRESAELQAMPGVFATGYLVGLLEWGCVELLRPHLDDGEGSLGIKVDFTHLAATLPGQTVTVEAEVTKVDGRRVSFSVTAHDGIDKISEGTHQRMVVPWDRFKAGVNAKAAKAGVAGV